MRPSEALHIHRDAIRRIIEAHHARKPRVSGSVLRSDDTAASDLDLLIEPTPETTLLDIGAIRHELLKTLGLPVDVAPLVRISNAQYRGARILRGRHGDCVPTGRAL